MITDNTELRASFEAWYGGDHSDSASNIAQQLKDARWEAYQQRDIELQAKLAAKDALLEEMVVALKDAADDLHAYVENQYSGTKLTYQSETIKYERDIKPVNAAKQALTKYEKEKHK